MPGFPHHRWPGYEAYRYLEHVGPTGLAWEWLRRDPAYHRLEPGPRGRTPSGAIILEGASALCEARWGCLNVEDAALVAPDASILWSAAVDPCVLRAVAVPAAIGQPDAFDLDRYAGCAALVRGVAGAEHLLVRGQGRSLRLDILEGTLLCGPVILRYDFSGVGEIGPPLATLRGYHHLCRTGEIPAPRSRLRQRDRRAIDTLRTQDALLAGASIRDVGMVLFGAQRVAEDWSAPAEALKSHCRRMIALAREMAGGRWRDLLQ